MDYRLVFLDITGQPESNLTFQTGRDDLAINIAEKKAAGRPLELWNKDRLVVRFRPGSWPRAKASIVGV